MTDDTADDVRAAVACMMRQMPPKGPHKLFVARAAYARLIRLFPAGAIEGDGHPPVSIELIHEPSRAERRSKQ